jgi:hypothetical protein
MRNRPFLSGSGFESRTDSEAMRRPRSSGNGSDRCEWGVWKRSLHYAFRKLGLRVVVGAEVGIGSGQRLTLLVETQQGYRNLCQLITRTKLRHGRN